MFIGRVQLYILSSQAIWIGEDINWVLCLFYYISLDRFVECCDLLYHVPFLIFINVSWSQEKGARWCSSIVLVIIHLTLKSDTFTNLFIYTTVRDCYKMCARATFHSQKSVVLVVEHFYKALKTMFFPVTTYSTYFKICLNCFFAHGVGI